MKLLALYAQRKERYVGQYLPVVLAAIDKNGNDENPDYLITEEKRQ